MTISGKSGSNLAIIAAAERPEFSKNAMATRVVIHKGIEAFFLNKSC